MKDGIAITSARAYNLLSLTVEVYDTVARYYLALAIVRQYALLPINGGDFRQRGDTVQPRADNGDAIRHFSKYGEVVR